MKVKQMLIVFFLSGIFWSLSSFAVYYKLGINNEKENTIKVKSTVKYNKEQREFIKQFQSAFIDR